jgi:solute carrier family 25 protein 38
VASAVILQPLDLLKTRVQQSDKPSLRASLRALLSSPNRIQTFWRGTLPSALRTGFGSALYFTTLNGIRQHARQVGFMAQRQSLQSASSALPSLTNAGNLFSGAAARTFAGFVLMPLTVIKVRFESSLYSYKSIWAASKGIHREAGVRGFFSGFGATALRDAPYAGMYVLLYEQLKARLSSLSMAASFQTAGPGRMQTSVASIINFSSAIVAGAACSAISNPFDAVKTRIQLQPDKYRNIWQACQKMVTEEGLRSLWDGLGLRMSRKALSSALAWTVYEELIRRSGMA